MDMTQGTATMGDAKTGRRSRIPLIFFGFFAVVLAANATMIWIALDSWTGLETRNHYLKGRDYNETLADVRAQEALGWTVSSEVVPAGGGAGRFAVTMTLTDASGQPLTADRVAVRLERPTHHGIDVAGDLTAVAPGVYSGEFSVPKPGQWSLRRLIWAGVDTHQTVERIYLDPESFE